MSGVGETREMRRLGPGGSAEPQLERTVQPRPKQEDTERNSGHRREQMPEPASGQPDRVRQVLQRQLVGQPFPDVRDGTGNTSIGDLGRCHAGKSEETIERDLFEVFVRSAGIVGHAKRSGDRVGLVRGNRDDAHAAEALGEAPANHRLRLAEDMRDCPAGRSEGVLRIRRPNRDYLLRVRSGEFAYEDLVARAEEQLADVQAAFEKCSLPDQPDREQVNALLVEIREAMGA